MLAQRPLVMNVGSIFLINAVEQEAEGNRWRLPRLPDLGLLLSHYGVGCESAAVSLAVSPRSCSQTWTPASTGVSNINAIQMSHNIDLLPSRGAPCPLHHTTIFIGQADKRITLN
jgi:hypothetical protein